ncbi:MAG: NAD-dependent epimerase/dehydratase family protein [Ruminococcus sp.]|nr:NAD-dependent epimerase/dehydratase family protein [Ruminococcus sp.]
MKNVIITGATGFVGFALTRELIKQGFDVTVLCRKGSERRRRFDGLPVKIIECDLSNEEKFSLCGEFDTFYHLAWEGGRNDFESQYKNISRTIFCLELAKKYGCERFICTGSQAEYGEVPADVLITEDTPLNPVTAYGSAKVAAYYLVRDFAKRLGVDYSWVRIFSVYGQNDNPNSLLPQILAAKKENRTFKMSTDGEHIWNYLHEDDAARGLIAIGKCAETNTIFNLAGSENMPLRWFISKVYDGVEYGTERSFINLNVSIEKSVAAIGEYSHTTFIDDILSEK